MRMAPIARIITAPVTVMMVMMRRPGSGGLRGGMVACVCYLEPEPLEGLARSLSAERVIRHHRRRDRDG